MESFYVGWGTLALINAGLAQGQNRSGGKWFLLSLLLGPVATLVLVVFLGKDDQTGGYVIPPQKREPLPPAPPFAEAPSRAELKPP